ncbi:helix-hairpin-helix domain-containing protein [Sphingomonas sp. BIUV-7]|uniref:Helix-hairpin-helix domain-containing protein n=1 Tax=Sphingomonas natans TaxID=3063330 RepID=A0ABT8Y7K3_9SPHN|nr:helix-hairpin-helix domain-containing protein [Sphingomonas sp. BIUV-7]MDO6414307.1 helix-hairpin-helix domain-containing protein [Sphingomonas sp. BIUV-7]
MPAVDINSATAADLDAVDGLRGHGFEIVRYREERGRFTKIRQLDEVPGLAGVLSDAQRDALTVAAAPD